MSYITLIRAGKDAHTELMKIIGHIQAKTGKATTIDDALKKLLENYKKRNKS